MGFLTMRRGIATLRRGIAPLAAAGLVAAVLLSANGSARAGSEAAPDAQPPAGREVAQVRVENAWIPQPPPGAEVAAAYFTLRNSGQRPAALVAVDSPLASAAMLHESSVVQGESRMRPVDRLTIPPGQAVTLKPGGLHVMLQGLTSTLEIGQEVPLVLHFAGGQEVHTKARVRALLGQ